MSARLHPRSVPTRIPARPRQTLVLATATLLALSLAASLARATESLEGVVELVEGGRTVPGAGGAVVSYEPEGGAANAAPRRIEIDTRGKRFLPRVTVVPRGSTVVFPNRDPIFHNVFSVSPANRFDLGRYREGQSRSARFDKPGLVRVYCNVHEQMMAYLMVVETPYHTVTEENGLFVLANLPDGRGTLTVWHERAAVKRIPIEVPVAEPLHIQLDATQGHVVPHLNKFGKPYGTEPDERTYR